MELFILTFLKYRLNKASKQKKIGLNKIIDYFEDTTTIQSSDTVVILLTIYIFLNSLL